jgi:hypothetical protein
MDYVRTRMLPMYNTAHVYDPEVVSFPIRFGRNLKQK